MFEHHVETLEIKKGEALFKEGGQAEHFYIVSEGKICSFKLNDGRIIPLSHSCDGELVAEEVILNDSLSYEFNAVAMEDTMLLKVPKSYVFDFLNSNSQWMKDILKDITSKLLNVYDTAYEHKIVDTNLLGQDDLTQEDQILLKQSL